GENDGREGGDEQGSGRKSDAVGKKGDGKSELKEQQANQHQIFPEEDVAEANRSHEVGLNSVTFIGKAVVGRGRQHQNEITHEGGEKGSIRKSPRRTPVAERTRLHGEQNDEQRR